MKPTKFSTLLTALIVGVFIITFSSCSKETTPSLTTWHASEIKQTSAKVSGQVDDDGGASVTQKGFCYNTSSNPTITDNSIRWGGEGVYPERFSLRLTGLDTSTQYYYNAYAINSAGVGYGEQKSFTTQGISGGACEGITSVNYHGQTYNTVEIGDQCWFKENLNAGTMIEWDHNSCHPQTNNDTIEKYCYQNDSANCAIYGGLYPWWGMFLNRSDDLCPDGWHVPSNAKWNKLADFLGGSHVAGGKMKETGTLHWKPPNKGATNSSGFTALPSGRLSGDVKDFENLTGFAYFWSSSGSFWPPTYEYYIENSYNNEFLSSYKDLFFSANSIRCLKD